MTLPQLRKRRWFQFRLRTLLAIVALVGIGCWVYFIGWSWWLYHREQEEFEQKAKQLYVGMEMLPVLTVPGYRSAGLIPVGAQRDGPASKWGQWFEYWWPNCTYILCVEYSGDYLQYPPSKLCRSIKVFKLPPTPRGYQAQSILAREQVSQSYPASEIYWMNQAAYLWDFLDFIYGNRKTNPGFKYELIYSDPPQKTQ